MRSEKRGKMSPMQVGTKKDLCRIRPKWQTHLFTLVQALPSQGACTLELPARPVHPAHTAHVQISFGRLTLLSPRSQPEQAPIQAVLEGVRLAAHFPP
jgi:hypothetical protein